MKIKEGTVVWPLSPDAVVGPLKCVAVWVNPIGERYYNMEAGLANHIWLDMDLLDRHYTTDRQMRLELF